MDKTADFENVGNERLLTELSLADSRCRKFACRDSEEYNKAIKRWDAIYSEVLYRMSGYRAG